MEEGRDGTREVRIDGMKEKGREREGKTLGAEEREKGTKDEGIEGNGGRERKKMEGLRKKKNWRGRERGKQGR